MKFPALLTAIFALATSARAELSWIWSSKAAADRERASFRKSFDLPAGEIESAQLTVTCDNGATASLNGERALENPDWSQPTTQDVRRFLKAGAANVLTLEAKNEGGPAGLLVRLTVKLKGAKEPLAIESGAGWEAKKQGAGSWSAATVIARYGGGPWGQALAGGGRSGGKGKPAAPEGVIDSLPGFEVEKLYTVPKKEQGSWVAMTTDPEGRLITGDQYGGLYRVTLEKSEDGGVKVEPLETKVKGAHGLCHVFGALYLLKNETGGANGLYRLRDTTGDGRYDSEELLRQFHGGGEHGCHSIVPSPDGKSLHLVFGNHTNIPKELDRSRPAQAWSEDHLLPRLWDANGHARGKLAPGGFIVKTDPDAKEVELVAYGFRNEFDAAFDQNGELFAFDADMEWDMGTPWYRPTRVYHAVSGLDAGWRSGTGKWPTHYPDSLPPAADVGPGSPTGVAMGTGAKFPAKYQRALFINDWTYGTMYAVHLAPEGGGFRGEVEEFVGGRPLPLTDVIIHPGDGAMYFLVGGRRAQSALYRVTYTGGESTAPVAALPMAAEAKLRRELEQLHEHGTGTDAIARALAHLGHPDRHVRHAARVAIERQPPDASARPLASALLDKNPWTAIEAAVALARIGDKAHQPGIFEALGKLDAKTLTRDQRLAWLRAHSLACTRMGEPAAEEKAALAARLAPLFPSGDNLTDRDLAELLIYLGDPGVVGRALAAMATAKDDHADHAIDRVLARNTGYARAVHAAHASRPNLQQFAYLFMLRGAEAGWTPELRRTYFTWFRRAAEWKGGNSLKKFIENIRKEALANIAPEGESKALDEISKPAPAKGIAVKPPEGPGRSWTVAGAVEELEGRLGKGGKGAGRDFARGKELYIATACASCHRMAGEGGGIGPDLTGSGARYTLNDLLENIVEPSKVISDQYGSVTITGKDGSVIFGRIGGETEKSLQLMTNPFAPESLIEVPTSEIAKREVLPASMMPPGLINTLNPEELADLVAYLTSGGNPEADVFQSKE